MRDDFPVLVLAHDHQRIFASKKVFVQPVAQRAKRGKFVA
jgi:hypothetical protein